MKVEDCIVTVERRSTGGCIDLAFVFARHFAVPLYRLTAWFAVPAILCVWLIGQDMRHDVFLPAAIIFAGFSTLLSAAMVATVGPQVFGVPISTRAAIRGIIRRLLPYLFLGVLARLSGFCLVVPLLFVMAWCGHLPEVMFLEKTRLNNVTQRLSQLSKGGGYSRNLGALTTIGFMWAIVGLGLFMIFDLLSGWIFNAPIFFGTIAPGPDLIDDFRSRVIDDPIVVTALHACFWLTYPIARLAWFFRYLDQRVRNECWDIELQFRTEAVRLKAVTP